jgi:hypothetical protein
MAKKIFSIITLMAFILFTMSCTMKYVKKKEVGDPGNWEGKNVKIRTVQLNSGEMVEFPKDSQGRILRGMVVGYGKVKKVMVLEKSNIQKTIQNGAGNIYVQTKEGKTYEVSSYEDKGDAILVKEVMEQVSIPLAEVSLLTIEKTSSIGLILITAGTVILLAALLAEAGKGSIYTSHTSTSESCPLVYSYDGERYVFDAEPYGGAICQGLERTDWGRLENLKEVDGKYNVLVANELDETQYTDALKLVVVDHPSGVKAAPDLTGKIHTVTDLHSPLKAFDKNGNDILPLIADKDQHFWLTNIKEKSTQNPSDLKDELILEFHKPPGASKAKLMVDARTTLWGSKTLKRYLDLHGEEVDRWYQDVNSFGPERLKMANMLMREECFFLKINIETEQGWKTKGLMSGGGPLISEDRIYPLDISDVKGDILRIKLSPPAAFWMIDSIAVDFTKDMPVTITKIAPSEAFDNNNQDVKKLLANRDNLYHEMTNTGENVRLVFQAPPGTEGSNRSFFLEASGYYDIHIASAGRPNRQILDRLHEEPGFLLQYAFDEYLKWKKEALKVLSVW